VERRTYALPFVTAILFGLFSAGCDREAAGGEAPAAAPAAVDSPMAGTSSQNTTEPDEIYFDLTRFPWYREGRPLVHNGRSYMPQADPTPVDVQLREAGSYEGVTYYAADDAPEPVYTLYVPVYYRYWQRFTSPPGN
jgi:hypothetical protein